MKWAAYHLLFSVVWLFLLPGFLVRMCRRGGYAARMGDRFGSYPAATAAKIRSGWRTSAPPRMDASGHEVPPPSDWVWVHAVSVGEVQVAGQLMREWRAAEPDVRFCFSTTSSTGWRMAEREISERDVLIYNPLDFPNYVKSALGFVRPRAIILTESEIWPVFIRTAAKRGIPLFLVNARVSDRSAPRYRLARGWFKDVFSSFTRIFAQSDLDKERLVAAGAPAERIDVTGSFKFDVAARRPEKERDLAVWLASENGRRLLLGGSTWPGEDEALLRIVRALSGVTLVLAPRHFEKADAVEANIRRAGFACVRRSRGDTAPADGTPRVYLADTTGELMGLYALADVVFVGKSLCAHGSQNMIEPCLCGKPTLVGPHTENFRPVMSDLLAADAVVQAEDEAGLSRVIRRLFADTRAAAALGERAAAAVLRRQGVVAACLSAVRRALA